MLSISLKKQTDWWLEQAAGFQLAGFCLAHPSLRFPLAAKYVYQGLVEFVIVGWIILLLNDTEYSPTSHVHPEAQNVILLGNSVFADGIQISIEISSHWMWVGPKGQYPYKRQRTQIQKKWPCEDRNWSYAATSQGRPGATRNWVSQGKIGKILP